MTDPATSDPYITIHIANFILPMVISFVFGMFITYLFKV